MREHTFHSLPDHFPPCTGTLCIHLSYHVEKISKTEKNSVSKVAKCCFWPFPEYEVHLCNLIPADNDDEEKESNVKFQRKEEKVASS